MSSDDRRKILLAPALAITLTLIPWSVGWSQSPPKITADRFEILAKLSKHQFDRLGAELDADQKQAEQDPHSEINAMVAFASFDTPQDFYSSQLDDWVKVAPNSYSAALARAIFSLAVEAKLRDRGESTSHVGLPDKFLRDAKADLDRAISLDRNAGLAYATEIKLARFERDPDELKAAKAAALSAVPASFAVREQIMYSLRPGFGGSYDEMQQFAEASQSYASDNPAMQYLKGWIAIDTGDDLAAKKQPQAAIDSYTHALEVGGDYWLTYRRLAETFYTMGKWNDALHDAIRSNELFPDNLDTLKLLAFSTAKLDQTDASIKWLGRYLMYDIGDMDVMALMKVESDKFKAGESQAAPVITSAEAAPTPKKIPESNEARSASAQSSLSPEQEEFVNLEQSLPTEPMDRFYALAKVAVAAYKAGEMDKAQAYANELLSDAARNTSDWNYGNAIYYGNFVNGLVALKRDNNLELAGNDLIAAGRTPGSPQLNSFGPNMLLAKELLARGDQHTVLEFFDLCRQFWKHHVDRLDDWTNTVKAGGTPDFDLNLNYD
ncbi:MAG TPA: hypothetical protein VMU16_11690 [Candidatus Binataceae bacterium]|nr:hypothetical protein [Candidatus Binataceae bacterium]